PREGRRRDVVQARQELLRVGQRIDGEKRPEPRPKAIRELKRTRASLPRRDETGRSSNDIDSTPVQPNKSDGSPSAGQHVTIYRGGYRYGYRPVVVVKIIVVVVQLGEVLHGQVREKLGVTRVGLPVLIAGHTVIEHD